MKILETITKPVPYLIGLFVGILIAIPSTLSFLRNNWVDFHPDFFFWGSIIMTIASILLAGFSIWQYLSVQSEIKKGDAQVKIWMQDASGLENAIRTLAVNSMDTPGIPSNKYSTVNDIGMAVFALASSANALYQSLYEERCVTEEEYTKQQKELGDAMHKQKLEKLSNTPKNI